MVGRDVGYGMVGRGWWAGSAHNLHVGVSCCYSLPIARNLNTHFTYFTYFTFFIIVVPDT